MATSGREENKSIASGRWKLLKKAILSAGGHSTSLQQDDVDLADISVRHFTSFELFRVEKVQEEQLEDESIHSQWMLYSYPSNGARDLSSLVRYLPEKVSLTSMMGFNNTGNVCVWPSEEIMAFYCLRHREHFRNKTVCELGGGMTCLAGLMLAMTGLPARVKLTDGNSRSIDNMQHILKANKDKLKSCDVSSEQLIWNQKFLDSEYPKFDLVICADCFFFVELHTILVQVISKLLCHGGQALLFAPQRSRTLQQFCEVVEEAGTGFEVEKSEVYDDEVWERHAQMNVTNKNYRKDLHYPLMVRLIRTT